MFYDWFFFRRSLEHLCVGISSNLCGGKEDEEEIKFAGAFWPLFSC